MASASVTQQAMDAVQCAFCRGTGRDPFGIMSERSACCVCGGPGLVRVQKPCIRCAHCQGAGAIKTLTCTVCGGTGSVKSANGPTIVCPECRGTGDDASASAMACLNCHGRGWVSEPQLNEE